MKNSNRTLEHLIERAILSSRWLLLVFYFGLAASLGLYAVHFLQELFIVSFKMFMQSLDSNDVLLKMLVFIDKTLVASLIVMVMLSGYENFISRFDAEGSSNILPWLGKLNPGSLKIKLASSIVAISSIHLLKVYLDIEEVKEQWHVLWLTIIHVVFLSGALMLGFLERVSHSHDD